MAAVMGGTQSLHTNSRDEALALPTEDSARIALRTQQIIAHESGVANTVDPFGGSWHIERLTNQIETGALDLLERIEAMGGTLRAIETGYIQRQIQDSAYKAQQAIDAGASVVVGVNRFATDERPSVDVFTLDPDVERRQIAKVHALRARRDASAWTAALEAVSAAAGTRDNLVPPIVAAVEAGATVGEIADTMRRVFGEFREVAVD
jgi:methylmalonyl-CoA mutase N-terminal domain/subunit